MLNNILHGALKRVNRSHAEEVSKALSAALSDQRDLAVAIASAKLEALADCFSGTCPFNASCSLTREEWNNGCQHVKDSLRRHFASTQSEVSNGMPS